MLKQEKHLMQLEISYPSGAEEWHCLECERRFIVQWPPNYQKILLEVGDEYAIHAGGKGGIFMQDPQVHSNNGTDITLSDEWHAAFDELDFDDWAE